MKRRTKEWLIRFYMRVISIFRPIKKQIVFNSFGGTQYSDSPRAISERIHDLYPDYTIIWYLNSKVNQYDLMPSYVQIVSGGLSFFKALATSFCYVTNNIISTNIYKRKNQFFVQTWHGDKRFKKILYENGLKRETPILEEKFTDISLAASVFGEKSAREAFHYYGPILNSGLPRNDCLLHIEKEKQNIIKERLGIDNKNTKILLYAPTFRDNSKNKQNINVDIDRVLSILSIGGENWICLFRFHPNVTFKMENVSEKIINVTNYPDMADLLYITDFLISDYSSAAGDFCITRKPIIMAIYDQEDFEKNCRAFKVTPQEAGFIVAKSQDELDTLLKEKTKEDYKKSCETVDTYFGTKETGKSTLQVCTLINNNYNNRFGK